MKSASGRWFLALVWALTTTVSAADIQTAIDQFNGGHFDEAETELRDLAKESPNDEIVNYYLGKVLIEKKQYAAAADALNKAMEASAARAEQPEPPTPSDIRTQLGIAHMYDEKLDEAAKDFEAAAPDEQENPDYLLHYGMLLLKQNKSQDSAQKLQKAVDLDPNNAYAHYYLGLAENNLGRADLMLVNFRKFLELAPDTPEAARVRSLLNRR